jgi:hypothetical protein
MKFLTYATFLLFLSLPAFAGDRLDMDSHGKKVSSGGIALAPDFQPAMQCVLKKLEGKQIKDLGCFGTRSGNRSAHPTGHACDLNQESSGKNHHDFGDADTEKGIASDCGAVSGCLFEDCGHFESPGKTGYVAAGTSVAGAHFYGKQPFFKKR